MMRLITTFTVALAAMTASMAGAQPPSPVLPAVPPAPVMVPPPVPPIGAAPVVPPPTPFLYDAPSFSWEFQVRSREAAEKDRDQREKEREAREKERDARERERDVKERDSRAYEEAQRHLDRREYARAIERFTDVVTAKGSRAEGALYWKAFAQYRHGQRAEALTTIAALIKDYPNGRYVKQAKALEIEVRKDTGQPVRPENTVDEDTKLIAIQALSNADPEQIVPMLEKLLDGPSSPRIKERALFVLAQSNSARAREVLKGLARGNSTPELQAQAINYLGIHGGRDARAVLAEVYSATNDVDAKRRIIRAFMVSGERDRLFTLAQSEQNADLRAEAVRQLGVMGAHEQLWTLYQKDSSVDVKKQILQSMFVAGQATRMIELAKTEQNPELRRMAVRNLGIMGSKATGAALVDIYSSDKDSAIRSAAINGLFIQNNAEALVALARKEEDPARKRDLVQKLSVMHNKVATDYMLEILNK
jgi:HEAT repeat protein